MSLNMQVISNPPNVNTRSSPASANVAVRTPLSVPGIIATHSSPDIAAGVQVRLPGFWRHSPQQWFIHVEEIFEINLIRLNLIKVNHVLSALDEDCIRIISDLVGPDIPYSLVKQRLISAFSFPQAISFRTIAQPGGIGDRRPSQYLHYIRNILPDGIDDAAVKEIWLQNLPQHILTVISGFDGSLECLAEQADRIMDASAGCDISVDTPPRDFDHRLSAIESALLALTEQIAALVTSQSNSTKNRPENHPHSRARSTLHSYNEAWCFYHNKYGQLANNCREWCTFQSGNWQLRR